MIENPKVGQRVWDHFERRAGTIVKVNDEAAQVRVLHDPIGELETPPIWAEYRDCYTDPARLREQAQELLLAASKLEQEETNA